MDVGRWNQRSLSTGELARHYGFTDVDGSQPDIWRYITEVREGGKQANLRVCPKTSGGITKLSEHEAD